MKKIQYIIAFLVFATLSTNLFAQKNKKSEYPPQVKQEYYLSGASQAYHEGKLNDARQLLQLAIDADSSCAACYYLLANVTAKAGYIKNAAEISRKAFNIDTSNYWYGKQLARLSELSGDTKTAIETYKKILGQKSEKIDVYYALGNLYRINKQYAEAETMYDSIQKYTGFDERLALSKQQLYYFSGNKKAAAEVSETYYAQDSLNPQACVFLGESYAQNGKMDKALALFTQAYNIDNSYAAAQFGLAEIYRSRSDQKNFFIYLNKIIDNESVPLEDKIEYLTPAMSLYQTNKDDIENAIVHLSNIYSGKWTFDKFYAAYLMQTDRKPEAINVINSAINIDKTNAEAWDMKISVFYIDKKWNQVLPIIDSAISNSPKTEKFYIYKSAVLNEDGKNSQAITNLEETSKIIKTKTFAIDAQSYLGDLYHDAGNKKKAYSYYENVLKLDPDNVNVLNNYAYFLSVEGKKLKHALEMSKRTIEKEPNNATYLDTYGWILHCLGRDEEARPVFSKAMANGGLDSNLLLDHYGDVLFSLKDYDKALIYWQDAMSKSDSQKAKQIQAKIEKCKALINKK